MKLITKIAFLIVLIVSVSSCQKENLPTSGGCSSHEEYLEGSRISNSSDTVTPGGLIIDNEDNSRTEEIVGGGDDDRDGGDGKKGKRIKK